MSSNGRQAERSEAAMVRAREAALELFSTQGYGATSMRQISQRAGVSVGNLYHHFGSKETIYQQLLDDYWQKLLDPNDELQQLFERADFPDDLEEMAALIERSVDAYAPYIMLIFIDVVEFRGRHIHAFYESMPARFAAAYQENFARKRREGRLGDADALVAVMLATRWLYLLLHGREVLRRAHALRHGENEAVNEFIRILRKGVLPRSDSAAVDAARAAQPEAEANLKGRRP